MTRALRERVSELSAAALLPPRLSDEGARIPERLDVVVVDELADDAWLVLLSSGTSLYGCPLVEVEGQLCRASAGLGAAYALVSRLTPGISLSNDLRWHVLHTQPVAPDEVAMGVDQTHDSIVVGSQAVVKWAVHAEPSPAPDLVSHLAENGFRAMPKPWAFVTSERDEESVVLVTVADFLPEAQDGWDWMVDDVAAWARGESDVTQALDGVRATSRIVAEMHAAASHPSSIMSAPLRRATSADANQWHQTALDLLAAAHAEVTGAEGERLRALETRIRESLDVLGTVDHTLTIPIHGDLHVGQILRWRGGYAVNDFDGNPVLPASERLRPQPVARDVAGMMQALDHVGRVVIKRRDGVDASRVLDWIDRAQGEFLEIYLATSGSLGTSDLFDERLLQPFRVEQELREFLYAERHLPRWSYVPDAAITSLLA